jgi:cytochrome c6
VGFIEFCDSRVAGEHAHSMKLDLKTISLLGAPLIVAAVLVAAPAAENWENHCAKCHGADGKGQTKAGRKLNVRDYTDPKVQAEMKDADMIKATADGIKDKAGKERMKGYKDELSAKEIEELVAYIRKMKA